MQCEILVKYFSFLTCVFSTPRSCHLLTGPSAEMPAEHKVWLSSIHSFLCSSTHSFHSSCSGPGPWLGLGSLGRSGCVLTAWAVRAKLSRERKEQKVRSRFPALRPHELLLALSSPPCSTSCPSCPEWVLWEEPFWEISRLAAILAGPCGHRVLYFLLWIGRNWRVGVNWWVLQKYLEVGSRLAFLDGYQWQVVGGSLDFRQNLAIMESKIFCT